MKTMIGQVGKSFPLGATLVPGGANFSVYAKHSTAAQLLLFDDADAPRPSRVIDLDPRTNRTYHYWHVFVPDLIAGQAYAYRVAGPFDPARGLRFDPDKVLLDPYGKCVARPAGRSREAARHRGDNAATALKSIVADPSTYDWQGDTRLGRPFAKTIIYEMHVGGFTRHPSSGVAASKRGTYGGLIEKIPYLQDLGVSAVELLPVFAFDEEDGPPGLGNYWGYQPLSFFAPHGGYSSRSDPLGALDEFRDMVKALHRAGIEVILDVVYNHTAEGEEDGPTASRLATDRRARSSKLRRRRRSLRSGREAHQAAGLHRPEGRCDHPGSPGSSGQVGRFYRRRCPRKRPAHSQQNWFQKRDHRRVGASR
jgi:isoamylase